MFYIVKADNGKYLTPRRNTGVMYENRSTWSKDIGDAKIFNTKGAGTNSGNKNGQYEFKTIPVKIIEMESV